MGTTVSDLITGMKIFTDANIHHYDPFIAPSPWRDQEFLEVQNNKNKIKIGVLQESGFLPCSNSVKRAMKLTEKALQDLGYEVVPFVIPEKSWDDSRNYLIGMLCNAALPMIRDFKREGEAMLKPLAGNTMILLAGPFKRFFIDTFLKLSN
jgi:Asp-tRNA(Asn)/Glu-tRNA(Gln) amidotransferase A subunit family amidase